LSWSGSWIDWRHRRAGLPTCFPVLRACAIPACTRSRNNSRSNVTGSPDGAYPSANLIFDAKGNFYGTTANGGTGSCSHGCGIVFKLDSSGKETVLYSFAGSPDGAYPTASLIFDPNGNLYVPPTRDFRPAFRGLGIERVHRNCAPSLRDSYWLWRTTC